MAQVDYYEILPEAVERLAALRQEIAANLPPDTAFEDSADVIRDAREERDAELWTGDERFFNVAGSAFRCLRWIGTPQSL